MRMLSIAAMLSVLGACGPDVGIAEEKGEVQIESVPDSEMPTDGSIHVIKRSKFVIEPATLFCGVDAEVDDALYKIGIRGLGIDGPALSNALKTMGQLAQHIDGSARQRMLDGKHCANDGVNVIYSGHVGLNRRGKPYRLTLVVRQGDALWQGIVEHPNGLRVDVPDIFVPSRDSLELPKKSQAQVAAEKKKWMTVWSIKADREEIQRKFLQHITSSVR